MGGVVTGVVSLAGNESVAGSLASGEVSFEVSGSRHDVTFICLTLVWYCTGGVVGPGFSSISPPRRSSRLRSLGTCWGAGCEASSAYSPPGSAEIGLDRAVMQLAVVWPRLEHMVAGRGRTLESGVVVVMHTEDTEGVVFLEYSSAPRKGMLTPGSILMWSRLDSQHIWAVMRRSTAHPTRISKSVEWTTRAGTGMSMNWEPSSEHNRIGTK
jgi:hypothetical protein